MIETILEKHFPYVSAPLNHSCPYTLLIAVLLSAQCTDERVNKVTPALFKIADTPEKMVRLNIETILGCIKTCGLGPTKARAIHALSQILVNKHKGTVPPSLKDLEELPGVGHKTASVVLCQAFNIPAFPVDTHIFRSARRWGLSNKDTVAGVEADLKTQFKKERWAKLHLQIILFARKYCPARGHLKEQCPICNTL